MDQDVLVIGAGMVGVSCALALQRRGLRVGLVDRRAPGQETSYGNAGCLARTSLIPFNNPTLPRNLPRLLRNNSPQFRYRPGYLLRQIGWSARFIANSQPAAFARTVKALDELIRVSIAGHHLLMREAGVAHRLRDTGWLWLYRSQAGFAGSAFARDIYQRHGIHFEALDADGIRTLEPDLLPGFERGLWIKDCQSVDDPGAIVQAYAALFAGRGGQMIQQEVASVLREGEQWQVTLVEGGPQSRRVCTARHVVIALGPWAKPFLATMGLNVPMAYERGYHRHFGAQPGATLRRPIYDTAAGYVMSPMAGTQRSDGSPGPMKLRVSTGVELDDLDAPPGLTQIDLAELAARRAFPLGDALQATLSSGNGNTTWLGRRPTLPDSRPMIGAVPGQAGLWCAFGHQHIGFSTGTGTAALLAALLCGDTPPMDPAPFSPSRFLPG